MARKKQLEEVPSQALAPVGPRPRLKTLRVSNFRCIGSNPVEIDLDEIVVLVGPNNAGKSSILRAYQVVMEHGSEKGKLALDDFPNGKIDPNSLPTIELETVVYEKTAPGERWVKTDPQNGEMSVKERWTWNAPGAPKKVGYDVTATHWDDASGPWGAPNVAQAYRPQPHVVSAFQRPEELATEVVELLSKAIKDRVKDLSKKRSDLEGSDEPSEYEKLISSITELRRTIASEATDAVADVQERLAEMIGQVFPGYAVTFDPRPEDDVDKALNIYKPDPILKMGPAGGFHTTLERQGSGTCRTLIWTALRILSERTAGGAGPAMERPHLLLMDEPEICLHPDAIREACRVLYDLPKTKNWQVMITTHSPVFVDLSRDNTAIARVERAEDGQIRGTTIYRPSKAHLDDDDRAELKLLNLCDPYVAEFFFGGRTVLVEGDTEFTAFRHVIAQEPAQFKDIHVVRARGKACLSSLCKILNQFDKGYSILHDSDREKVLGKKSGVERANPAWKENEKLLQVTKEGREQGRIRLVASIPNFEEAFFGEEAYEDKPFSALARLKSDDVAYQKTSALLKCLVDRSAAVPLGAMEWADLAQLRGALAAPRKEA